MKEALGNSYITIIVVTFIGLLIVILASSSAYSKAVKVRNRIMEMIENNQGYTEGIVKGQNFIDEIDSELSKYGYRINTSITNNCKPRSGNDANGFQDVYDINSKSGSNTKYDYCVYEYKTVKGVYYGVEAYMYFDIPLVDNIKIGVYGETKTLYDLTEF